MSATHPLVRIETLVLVAVGGAVGANLRYVLGTSLPGLAGTLAANAFGSLALGFLLYEAMYTDLLAKRTRVVLGTGLLSSFTTYSTFAVETALSAPAVAAGYVLASYAVGFAAVVLGSRIAASVRDATPVATEGV